MTEDDVDVMRTAAMVLNGFNKGALATRLSDVATKLEREIRRQSPKGAANGQR
jgi:hypothetical protein